MNVFIRVDASIKMGSGHVMRCLALAEGLRFRNNEVTFICRAHSGNRIDLIDQKGFSVIKLPFHPSNASDSYVESNEYKIGVSSEEDSRETCAAIMDRSVDWLIVDHYSIDACWHRVLRKHVNKLMVIDDLANRELDCDLVLDQGYGRQESDYRRLIPKNALMLLGPQYALLRNEFPKLRRQALQKRKEYTNTKRILVSMGGMDAENLTGLILEGLSLCEWSVMPEIDVVLGKIAPHLGSVYEMAQSDSLKISVHTDANNMAELMLAADIAFGAGGSTSWERCCLGLPSIMTAVAENQQFVVLNLAQSGAVVNMGSYQEISASIVKEFFMGLYEDRNVYLEMSEKASLICDGLGVNRVLNVIEPVSVKDGMPVYVTPALMEDVELIFQWQQDKRTREYSKNSNSPAWEEHSKWMQSCLSNNDKYLNMIVYGDTKAGVIRLDRIISAEYEAYMISIFISPIFYNLGLGAVALEIVRDMYPSAELQAEILPENDASINLFIKSGYVYDDIHKVYVNTIKKPGISAR